MFPQSHIALSTTTNSIACLPPKIRKPNLETNPKQSWHIWIYNFHNWLQSQETSWGRFSPDL